MFMSKKAKKRFAIATFASVLTIVSIKSIKTYRPTYEIYGNLNGAYGRYEAGYVYIGDEAFIESLDKNEFDVYVVDEREDVLNMKILNSYKIYNFNYQRDILNIIEDYENNYPSEWERSVETMMTEWNVHNFLYGFSYQEDRTRDVDFENSEEELYKEKILTKLFK